MKSTAVNVMGLVLINVAFAAAMKISMDKLANVTPKTLNQSLKMRCADIKMSQGSAQVEALVFVGLVNVMKKAHKK